MQTEAQMPELIVHAIPGSPFLRAVLIALKEKRAAYVLDPMPLGSTGSDANLRRNPFGRVPVITHGDFVLYETQAIIRYVDSIFPKPSLTPADARQEARMNQLVGIADWYVFPYLSAGITHPRVIAPLFGWPSVEAVVQKNLPKARTAIAAIEGLIGAMPFLAAETLTIADCMLAPHLDFLLAMPEGREMLAASPKLAAWLERMRARESLRETDWSVFEQMLADLSPSAAPRV
jgi:glutathione S-transferase